MSGIALTGRVGPADRAREPVLRLPFKVPDGTTRIDVTYRFDEGHVLDLGLADPHLGAFPSREGFRGWSGGARRAVFIARDAATPGYLPGPIPAGSWSILLGLARVDGPCEYRIDVTLDDAPRPLVPPVARDHRVRGGPGWYAGDLQAHTHHSDARGSLDDLARAAAERGLDFVAVTDHNTVAHHRPIAARGDAGPLIVPGEEITSYRGHANVWGADGWIDFRVRSDDDVARLVTEAHLRGGLFSVNHPKEQPGCIGCDWDYEVPAEADAYEAWQGPWPLRNWESLSRYDALLAAGRRLTLVGGSDRHQPVPPEREPDELRVGSPTTWVRAEALSVEGVLDAVRLGRACVAEGPDGPRLEVSGPDTPMGGTLPTDEALRLRAEVYGADDGDLLRWRTPSGVVRERPIEGPAFEDVWTLPELPTFARAEVVARDGVGRHAAWATRLEEAAAGGANVAALRRELAAARGRPWIRALSNPLYGARRRTRHPHRGENR